MNLKTAYNLTKKFSSKSYHYGSQEYTPSSNDKIKYLQKNGNELVIYLDIKKEGSNSVKMRFGEAYKFINKIMFKDINVYGNTIIDSVYTSEGFVTLDKFKEAEDTINNLPQLIDYEMFLTESVSLKEMHDNVDILESGEMVLYFKLENAKRFPGESPYLLSAKKGKRMFAKVLLNDDNKFEVVETPRVRKTDDIVLSLYPDALLTDELNEFVISNDS